VTWSTDSTIASITPPTGVVARAARSSAHQGVPKPLMRTQSTLPAPSQLTTLSRAACLSLGATASSMSKTTMSARESTADWNRSGCVPLTSSQLRASTGSMREPMSSGAAALLLTCSYISLICRLLVVSNGGRVPLNRSDVPNNRSGNPPRTC